MVVTLRVRIVSTARLAHTNWAFSIHIFMPLDNFLRKSSGQQRASEGLHGFEHTRHTQQAPKFKRRTND
jgi:hypothetical protein